MHKKSDLAQNVSRVEADSGSCGSWSWADGKEENCW